MLEALYISIGKVFLQQAHDPDLLLLDCFRLLEGKGAITEDGQLLVDISSEISAIKSQIKLLRAIVYLYYQNKITIIVPPGSKAEDFTFPHAQKSSAAVFAETNDIKEEIFQNHLRISHNIGNGFIIMRAGEVLDNSFAGKFEEFKKFIRGK